MILRLEDVRWEGLFPQPVGSENLSQFAELHRGQSVLVTGAGGSIGSALSKAIHQLQPRSLVLLDSSEQNLYYIHRELSAISLATEVFPVLGSVANPHCVRDVFRRFHPDVIYHAAALKHVPLGEMNPFAVVENNIFGTQVMADASREFGVARLIMISTDKSVNPQSVMGASKRVAEVVLREACDASTRMTSIRLGNVLGSEGSVVPLFLEQIAHGGPVTVTDPDVERYFLTMEETVCRVLSAAAACPGEPAVAVPLMGSPVKIADLARYLIRQATAPHVQITFTGLRPGDKLHEEFVAANETVLGETADGLQWISSPRLPSEDLSIGLAHLEAAMEQRDLAGLLITLTRLVPEYRPTAFLREQATAVAQP
ncbi:MAG TPA: polysaccharide biosynthesis protein [Candidatus Angelobacter sp.]|nr:polysaccharide biosynthesis protein [Candidatus Angelobacter sp.]